MAAISREEFVDLLQDEIGLAVGGDDLGRALDEVPGWDSLHLLTMLVLLEKRVRRPLSLPDFLEAASLESVYELVNR
ncbi:acyl carrier protein [Microbispora triticiradicis]|uniref:Acyl carrier protein n=1 Tax=Microbispora triticiradicis TaxID=2200763 RepID=A0ABX9LJ65_9ACTN|nr:MULTISPECIES: acyl carrier protein [Microbispora]RGA03960.1 acyl carrier protein [Microbispora triticiradicis]